MTSCQSQYQIFEKKKKAVVVQLQGKNAPMANQRNEFQMDILAKYCLLFTRLFMVIRISMPKKRDIRKSEAFQRK